MKAVMHTEDILGVLEDFSNDIELSLFINKFIYIHDYGVGWYHQIKEEIFIPDRQEEMSILQPRLPVSSFQAAFFAKCASMRIYPAEPHGSFGSQKSFNSP